MRGQPGCRRTTAPVMQQARHSGNCGAQCLDRVAGMGVTYRIRTRRERAVTQTSQLREPLLHLYLFYDPLGRIAAAGRTGCAVVVAHQQALDVVDVVVNGSLGRGCGPVFRGHEWEDQVPGCGAPNGKLGVCSWSRTTASGNVGRHRTLASVGVSAMA